MNKRTAAKNMLKMAMSCILVTAFLLSSALPLSVFANQEIFSGSANSQVKGTPLSAGTTGLPIIFENGMHYIEDPAYPGTRMILYCMNNKLKWPHVAEGSPVVPPYEEGYLTPDKFASKEQYEACMQKMRKILFAGYPYNGERLFQIVPTASLHTPTVQEFNHMLIVPPQLEADFPYLLHHEFSIADLHNEKHFNELLQFLDEVRRLFPDHQTPNGLSYTDITSMPFYKAVNSLTFYGLGAKEEDVLSIFANLYSASYFVTETQAYEATQFAIWKLLCEYKVENNDLHTLGHNKLAEVLWQYCQHGVLLDRKPVPEDISIEGDLCFSYHPKDGMWHSGKLRIVEPPEYNGLYHLHLPSGVTAICDGLDHVYGNEEYELVSAKKPPKNSQFGVTADIDWLKDMKQYSPIGDPRYQHMVGALMEKTPITKIIPYHSDDEGGLAVTKTVIGGEQDLQKAFSFTLELTNQPLNGVYGDMEFQNGVAHFTLKNGETKTALHLPVNTHYKVTEEESEDYRVHGSHAEGVIEKDIYTTVTFENTRLTNLWISKTIKGKMGDKTKPFTFVIDITKEDGTPLEGTYAYTGSVLADYAQESQAPADGTLTFQNGKATIQLSHGQQVQIKGLPFHCRYTVTEQEANQDGYQTTYNQSSSAASGLLDSSAQVHIVNTKADIPETGLPPAVTGALIAASSLAVIGLLIPLLNLMYKRKRKHRHGK